MNRFRNRFSAFQVFSAICILFFSVHLVIGYFYCVYSEYANCPGYFDTHDEEDESEDLTTKYHTLIRNI